MKRQLSERLVKRKITRAMSLLNYCRKYTPPVAVRCSMNDYATSRLPLSDQATTRLIDLPLYVVFLVTQLLSPLLKDITRCSEVKE